MKAGIVKTGTPNCVPSKEFCYIGICTGIQHNNKVGFSREPCRVRLGCIGY